MKEQILSGRVLEHLIPPIVQSLAFLRMFILVSNPPAIHMPVDTLGPHACDIQAV